MAKHLRLGLIGLICLIFLSNPSYSQRDSKENIIDNYYLSGAKKNMIDTLALQKAQTLAKETTGILEKEIVPSEYLLGPGDVFTISIIGAKSLSLDATISPEGKLFIPETGTVDLAKKNLEEAYGLIKEKISKVFKSAEVSVLLKKTRQFKVTVSGAIQKPNIITAGATDRVSEIIEKAGGLKFDGSLRKIFIRRDQEIIPVDLLRYYILGDKKSNPTVHGGDQIFVPTMNNFQFIEISGDVAFPKRFEFVEGDSLSTLIRFGQGFLPSSMLDSVEIARFLPNSSNITRWFVDLTSWRGSFDTANTLPNDIKLNSGDRVYIRQVPEWNKAKSVVVKGEVNLPGVYPIDRNEMRVKDIIERAGGFTYDASPEAALLIRQKEIEKSDREMERLSRLPYSEMSENERRYFQARISEQKGVMAIDFKRILDNPKCDDNIFVIDQDSIYVPSKKMFVNVQGRVNNPGLILFNPSYNYMDYINVAGGFGFRAEDDETLIVKSKGEQFRAKNKDYTIEPGDNILVPPEKEITFFEVFTTVLTITAQIVTILGVVIALKNI